MGEPRRVAITGYGLVSALGDLEQTWQGLVARRTPVTRRTSARDGAFPFARGYSIAEDTSAAFASRSDLRAMGPCMRHAVAAAGGAITSAGLRGRGDLLAQAGVFLAARHDARDFTLDAGVASEVAATVDYQPRLNELLSRRLRPGAFLAQLPNLYAGNLCIIFQILGTSMTFLGEQGAGAAALKEAASAIRAGELELALAGASFDGDEYQARFGLAGSGCLSPDRDETDLRAVEAWGVAADGTVTGAAAAFLVLESFEHARRREAQLRAELAAVSVESGPRRPGSIAASLTRQYEAARGRAAPVSAILGNGAGITGLDAEERTFLRHVAGARPDSYLTTPSPGIGEVVHASLPSRVVLAAAALERQQLFGVPPLDQARLAPPEMRLLTETLSAPLGAIAAVSIGPFEAESLALVQHAPAAERGP